MTDFSRRALLVAFLGFGMMIGPGALLAAEAGPPPGKRVALKGYDPVSYFTAGKPEPGSAEHQASYDGATYWFKNAKHRALFVADPDHYAPQFGGFCAINVSRGEKYEADPDAWAIADGKLYVFGGKAGVPIFQQQTAGIIEKAGENWAQLRRQP